MRQSASTAAPPSPHSGHAPLGTGLVLLMAVACGCGTGNIYYAQPLLRDIAAAFSVTVREAGLLQMAMQLGYGAGILLFVPLGDLVERRRLIVTICGAVACALAWVASSTHFGWLLAASLVMGATAQVSQVMIPFASDLSPANRRGKVVGILMAGLLVGILLARTVSGFVSEAFGWRAVYWMASAIMAVLGLILWRALPITATRARVSYGAALASASRMFFDSAPLRRSSFVGCLSFGAFSAFWTTLSFRLETPPLHYGADVAGLFGLLGAGHVVAWLCERGHIARGRTDYVIIPEPFGVDRICVGHRGVWWFEVTTHGERTAHGSMPFLGVSAIEQMAPVLEAVRRELKPALAARVTRMPVVPPGSRRATLNVNAVSGGQAGEAVHTPWVADRCTAGFDRRFLPEGASSPRGAR